MSQGFDGDGFGDVLESTSGIFGDSEGLEAFESVRHTYQQDGMVVQVHCENCGFPRHVTVTWPELIAIRYNVSPHEAYSPHPQMQHFAEKWENTANVVHYGVPYAWYPASVRCKCGGGPQALPFRRPLIRPSECDSHLHEARRNGWLQKPTEQALHQQANAVAQHLHRL